MISTHSDEYDSIENILMDDLGEKTYRVQQHHRLEEKTNHVSLSVEENLKEDAEAEAPDVTDRTLVMPIVPLHHGSK